MRKFLCFMGLLLLIALVSVSASAQDNTKVDLFGGYSYLMFRPNEPTVVASKINFNGGVGSISYNPSSWLGIVGEVGGYHAGTVKNNAGTAVPGATFNAVTYLFGPKLFVHSGKITPFAQVLFGGAHGSPSGTLKTMGVVSENGFAMALGGGLDWNAAPHIAVRLGQVEYLLTHFSNTIANGFENASATPHQNNFRYSAGVVFRF